ncbi:MAG: hypothetical protein HW406_2972, partial [Candidatus Brocadiaceae bacterium]|nr:hypothetical protein [Candidatus Brocadiaceae bacterium]
KYLMQILDRLYFRVAPARIHVPQKPDSYDFSHLTKKEYLENPELFYINCFILKLTFHYKTKRL